jgi:hypothetical protein
MKGQPLQSAFLMQNYFLPMKKLQFRNKPWLVSLRFGTKPLTESRFTRYVALFLTVLCFLGDPSVSNAQSLQWSQFTSPSSASSAQTYAVEKVPNGAIYTLTACQANSTAVPKFRTNDVVLYGQLRSGSTYTYLSKYSADGATLEWVRVIGNKYLVSSFGNVEGLDLALTAAGEPVILYFSRAAPVADALITPDAWQSVPSNLSQSSPLATNSVVVLNKFSASGAVTYGTYIGPSGGSFGIDQTPANSASIQNLQVGSDGSVYVSFVTANVPANTQTGVMQTTANALSSTNGGNTTSSNLLIFKPDNTLAYSTYVATTGTRLSSIDQVIAPNGDYYAVFENPRTTAPFGLTVPSTAAYSSSDTKGGFVVRFDKNGNVINSSYLPNGIFNPTGNNYPKAVSARPNSNIVIATYEGDFVELTPDLTTVVQHFNPFGFEIYVNGSGGFCQISDIGIDDAGRIHFTAETSAILNKSKPSSSGALQNDDATSGNSNGYYGIVDCNLQKLVYGTQITNSSNGITANRTSFFQDIEIEGCTAYLSGRSTNGTGFPVTPSAYNDAGTTTIAGYDITPTITTSINSDGVLFAFNYPVQKAGTNVLTAPAITNFCKGSGVLPIDGTKTSFLTPNVIGKTNSSPAPTPTHYQCK